MSGQKSLQKPLTDKLINETAKASGFLDYKDLLGIHYLQPEGEAVNVFDLLVKTLLANTINPVPDRTLVDDWNEIKGPYPRRNAKNQIADLENPIDIFNIELANRLTELRPKVGEILGKFGYKVDLDLDFQGVTYNHTNKTLDNQQILLNVKFFDKDVSKQYLLLNEAKLSAIAISIYLSSILLLPEPKSELSILVLDILEEYFKDHQIFLMTYDKAWYEIAKQRLGEKNWKYTEFYFKATDEYEIPVCKEDRPYLEKAKEYLDENDYKACAIYVRTAFEAAIKKYCEEKDLAVKYRENPKDLKSEDFWVPIKTKKNDIGTLLLNVKVVDKIELARKFTLNELSHVSVANIYRKELEDAIAAVEELETVLTSV